MLLRKLYSYSLLLLLIHYHNYYMAVKNIISTITGMGGLILKIFIDSKRKSPIDSSIQCPPCSDMLKNIH